MSSAFHELWKWFKWRCLPFCMSLLLPAKTTTDDVESLCVNMLVIDGGLACCVVGVCAWSAVFNDISALVVVSAVILFGSDERISAAAFKIIFFITASDCLMDIGWKGLFKSAFELGWGGEVIIWLSAPIETGLVIKLVESVALLLHNMVGEMVEFMMMSESMVELFADADSTPSNEFGDVLIVGIVCAFSMTSAANGDGFVGLLAKQFVCVTFGKLSIWLIFVLDVPGSGIIADCPNTVFDCPIACCMRCCSALSDDNAIFVPSITSAGGALYIGTSLTCTFKSLILGRQNGSMNDEPDPDAAISFADSSLKFGLARSVMGGGVKSSSCFTRRSTTLMGEVDCMFMSGVGNGFDIMSSAVDGIIGTDPPTSIELSLT